MFQVVSLSRVSGVQKSCWRILNQGNSARVTGKLRDFVTSSVCQEKLKVLYDGQCPICVTEINLMKKLDTKNKNVNFIDITQGEYKAEEHSGITYQQAMGKMHVISSDGQISDSMDAMKKMYSAVGLDWLSRTLSLPGIKQAADGFYVWFAINRYRLTGRNREDCESGRCKIPDKK